MALTRFHEGFKDASRSLRLSALGDLGWLVRPWGLFVTTAAMVIAMWRRPSSSIGCKAVQAQEEKSSGVNERSITFHSP